MLKMSMQVPCDLPLVALSMFAAIGGPVVALAVVARPRPDGRELVGELREALFLLEVG